MAIYINSNILIDPLYIKTIVYVYTPAAGLGKNVGVHKTENKCKLAKAAQKNVFVGFLFCTKEPSKKQPE